jgi:hypothetical protein
MNSLLLSLVLSCTPSADGKTTCAPAGKAAVLKGGASHHLAGSQPAPVTPAPANQPVLTRGEKLKGLAQVPLQSLLSSPADFDGKTVAVEATVRKACERKGCWMELAGVDKGPGVRVTFKDYGFFVPLDSAGSTARVEGTVKVTELAAERAKHYESEGAQVAKDTDGKYREVQLVALGVELRK